MSGVAFDIRVITGDSDAAINGIISGFGTATGAANRFTSSLNRIGDTAFRLNNIKGAISGIASDFNNVIQPGIDFNYQLKETQAIAGVTNDQMRIIGASARQLAKDFGIDSTKAVESYKFILSQLGPELANTPKALEGMGRASAILSKQLGGDTAKATEILAAAMNQYGVSLKDPMKATETMGVMMNIMSAAAQEGSAEMPNIKSAIEASGMMAKTANVSFTELNAAIQVLNKAGKRGAEGGVAVRNVLADLAELPAARGRRVIRAMLEEAGISINALSDKSKTFSERLQLLKPIVGDTAAMTLLWNKENVAAGIALIQGTSEIDRFAANIKDTNSAQEMATTIMGAWSEKMERLKAKIKDIGISIFDSTKDFVPFIQIGMGALSVLANLAMATQLFTGSMWLLNAAFWENPITWVVAGVVALGVAIVVAYNKSQTFRAALNGLIESGKILVDVFLGVGKTLIGALTFNVTMIREGAIQAATAVTEIATGGIDRAFKKGYNAVIESEKIKEDAQQRAAIEEKARIDEVIKNLKSKDDQLKQSAIQEIVGTASIEGVEGAVKKYGLSRNEILKMFSGGEDPLKNFKLNTKGQGLTTMASNITGGGPRNLTVNIQKLQDQIVVHTTNLSMGAKQAADEIVEQILRVLNSINGKVANE